MANIMICGFPPKKAEDLKDRIDRAVQEIGLDDEALTSVVEMTAMSCKNRAPMPYLRICSTYESDIQRIINALKEARIKVDIEWLVLDGFIPADKMT